MARSGEWIHNQVTGELCRVIVGDEDSADGLLEADLFLTPDAAVAGEHIHDVLDETFEVIAGTVGFRLDGEEREVGPGAGVHVPAGAPHDWWNAGQGPAHVRVTVTNARRFALMIETMFSLANTGRTASSGMPGPLWLAALSHEFKDVFRVTAVPHAVQSTVFPALAAIARATGRDPRDPALTGPGSPCRLPGGGEQLVAEMGLVAG